MGNDCLIIIDTNCKIWWMEGNNIKRFLNVQRLIYSICLTMCISYIPFAQEVTSESMRLGFPYKFYTIHISHGFSIHFGIGTFVLDVLIIYLIFSLGHMVIQKLKKMNMTWTISFYIASVLSMWIFY